MVLSEKKIKALAVAAVLWAFSMEFVHAFFIVPFAQRMNLPYIISDICLWLITFGAMMVFGFICYGRDKRLFRFPLCIALGYEVGEQLIYRALVIFADLLSTAVYIDTSYMAIASVVAGAAVSLAVLIKFTGHNGLLYKETAEAEGEVPTSAVRHKAIFGNGYREKIIAIICGVSLVYLRLAVYFGYRLFAPLTLDLEGSLTSLGTDIADFLVGITLFALCFFISRGFAENNKGALYCLCLFCFVFGFTYIASGLVTDIVSAFGSIDAMAYFAEIVLYRILPVLIGDITAVLAAVLLCRFLSGSKEKITNGLS